MPGSGPLATASEPAMNAVRIAIENLAGRISLHPSSLSLPGRGLPMLFEQAKACSTYSWRRARMGSMDKACLAGAMAAPSPIRAIDSVTAASTSGSRADAS
jgi:hypothetical protein